MFDIDTQKAEELAKSFHIPPQPYVLQQLQLEQSKPDPCPNAFAEIIVRDVALSGSVLKTVNSPLFGLNRTITDIKQSVMMLGTKNISTLTSFFLLQGSFSPPSAISLEKFWDLAMQTANMVSILMEHLHLKSNVPPEDAYSYALFRDCGIPLMASKFENYREVLQKCNNSQEELFTDIEDMECGSNHAIMGYFLAASWNFPKELCQFILRHHDFTYLASEKVTDHDKTLFSLIILATNIHSQYKYYHEDIQWHQNKHQILDFFNLTELDYADLEEDVKDAFDIQFG